MRKPRERPRRSIPAGTVALLLVGSLIFTALGVTGTVLTLTSPQPASLAPATEITSIPTERTPFVDAHSVEFTLRQAANRALPASGSGTVTSNTCSAGQAITSGSVAYTLDNNPVIALATPSPLWRDLRPGDRGEDVSALQTAFADLGTGIQVDGIFGQDMLDVYSRILLDAGFPAEALKVIPVDGVLWLPESSIVPDTCALSVANKISGGEEYATISGGLLSASITPPTGAVSGARVLEVADIEIAVNDDGEVTSAEDLQRLTEVPGYSDAIRETDPIPLSGTWRLAEEVDALSVPATALTDLKDTSACIWQGDEGIEVEVLGSQLGQTLVKPTAEEPDFPAQILVSPDDSQTGCS